MEIEVVINLWLLVYVGVDLKFGFVLIFGDFFSLNLKIGVLFLEIEDE